jgi:hypothetical protein
MFRSSTLYLTLTGSRNKSVVMFRVDLLGDYGFEIGNCITILPRDRCQVISLGTYIHRREQPLTIESGDLALGKELSTP